MRISNARPCRNIPHSHSCSTSFPPLHYYQVRPKNDFAANLLHGFAAACAQVARKSKLTEVFLERKKSNGEPLDFEVSNPELCPNNTCLTLLP